MMVCLRKSSLALCCLWPSVLGYASAASPSPPSYAPEQITCPSEALSRPAAGSTSQAEQAYVSARSPQTTAALTSWLEKTLDSWPQHHKHWRDWHKHHDSVPELSRLGLALSGGGPKASLTAAGVIQGLDSRDSNTSVSGLLQSMSYVSALSGASFTLAGVMVNDFSVVSALRQSLWDQSFQNQTAAGIKYGYNITVGANSKVAAGYPASLVDLFGLLDGYNFLYPDPEAASDITWSSILSQSSFQSAQAPFPILTMTNSDILASQCFPDPTGPIWEVSPVEFGSWDPTVHAFTQTKYLGTKFRNGKPINSSSCTTGFDQTSFLIGNSADVLPQPVRGDADCSMPANNNVTLTGVAAGLVASYPTATVEHTQYGIVPNPFYGSNSAGNISTHEDLYLLDGGDTDQVIPIMPLLQGPRGIDVLFAVDENSSPPYNTTNGSSIYATYVQAQRLGLGNMPFVPDVAIQLALNFSNSPHFLGCYNTSLTTIVYLPNSLQTQFSSSTFAFNSTAMDSVISKGTDIVTQSDSTEWPKCLACAITHKTAPFVMNECASCLKQYCYAP